MAKLPDGKWYDLGNLADLHADLALHYEQVLRTIMSRPVLKKHYASCDVCQQLRREHQGERAAAAAAPRRRLKYVLTTATMRKLLQLPADHEIVIMYSTPDPNAVMVVVTGPGLPEVSEDVESPVAALTIVPGKAAAA